SRRGSLAEIGHQSLYAREGKRRPRGTDPLFPSCPALAPSGNDVLLGPYLPHGPLFTHTRDYLVEFELTTLLGPTP
ncbi:hypothetical protein, partial [Vibrio cholerae]|uniref:hypothetical protein n=1 Tax=Vibrio cholerae TaxID=666 RepID=UPI001F3C9BC3